MQRGAEVAAELVLITNDPNSPIPVRAGAIMALCSVLMASFPRILISFYTQDPGLVEKTMELLLLATFFQISDGLQVCATGALRGIKDTKVPMWCNAFAFWGFGLPLGAYLGLAAGLGARGFWIGLLAGLTLAAVLHNLRFYLLTRETKLEMPSLVASFRAI